MLQEASNTEPAFLVNADSPECVGYRGRLWSLAQGDSLKSWRSQRFHVVPSELLTFPATAAFCQPYIIN